MLITRVNEMVNAIHVTITTRGETHPRPVCSLATPLALVLPMF